MPGCLGDDVFYLFLQKQKVGAELHMYLEEGTYHTRLFREHILHREHIRQPEPRVYLEEGTYHTRLCRGPSTNDMKK
jgi:hypothetical protein